MSDHIDGPRQIGDPSADLTDLFAFTSPENPCADCVSRECFPDLRQRLRCSPTPSLPIRSMRRRDRSDGLGDATKFETADQEIRFSCRFDTSNAALPGPETQSRGHVHFPDGQNPSYRRQ